MCGGVYETLRLGRPEELQHSRFLSRFQLGYDVLMVEIDGVGWVGPVLFQPRLIDYLAIEVHYRHQKVSNSFHTPYVGRSYIQGKTCDGQYDPGLFQCDFGSQVAGIYGTAEEFACYPGTLDRLRYPPIETRAIAEKIVIWVVFEIHNDIIARNEAWAFIYGGNNQFISLEAIC